MGRRKIEIQPITHERNRAVTFLKRKNGLFKKAYELGVLCSVDVAVIIFEERPGHHVKCYEYCSRDIRDILDRHNRFDGERDTRTPADFGNNKVEDAGVDDDEEDDDDMGRGNKRKDGLRPKPDLKKGNGQLRPSELSMNVDSDYRTTMTIPSAPLQNLPMPSSLTNTSSLPISGERHNQPPNKRPKIAPTPGQLTPPGALSAHTPSFPYDHNDGYRLNYPVAQTNMHSHAAGFSNPGMFSGTPPPGSNALFDFPRPQRNPSYSDAYGGQQRLSHGHDASLFLGPGAGAHRSSTGQGQNFGGFDWPVHQQQHQQPQSQPPQSAHHSPTQVNHNPHDTSWLEIFASAPSQPAAAPPAAQPEPTPLHLPSAYPGSSGSSSDGRRPSLSWERQQHDAPAPATANTNQAGTASAPNSAVVSPALSHKRARVDSTASDMRPGSLASAAGVKDGDGETDRVSVNGSADGVVKKEGEGGEGQGIPAD
ncbi:hypothetical protein OE88DRAFT_1807169 [Heliocybe sulcata]|uniref:MADS-box domain-containing protein n=1 Tax=Heliocybe sulcata TaxID=5364 RepID=A0A5C3N502_9AGAM|nr:hypothetical protein OE88DRAFT_1807169 [Heliocybe sulcata]